MMHCRHAVMILALGAGVTTANAQQVTITREPKNRAVIQQIELTPAQRTTIYRTIVRDRDAPPAGLDVRVGGLVPEGVQLQAVPEAIALEVPAVRSYRYMVINNRVLLVDPATSTVVAEIAE